MITKIQGTCQADGCKNKAEYIVAKYNSNEVVQVCEECIVEISGFQQYDMVQCKNCHAMVGIE